MRQFFLRISVYPLLIVPAATLQAQSKAGLRSVSFDNNWYFIKANPSGAETVNFDDSKWRKLDLPHDWSIEDLPNQDNDNIIGPFSRQSTGATSTGYTIGGTAWYRKHFSIGKPTGKKVSIYFDGIYNHSKVWLNGHFLGFHPYGYTAFSYDLSPYLTKDGTENVLAVCVSNDGRNSRWYSGSGIYRHVWLLTTQPLHVKQWGTAITTPEVSKEKALVQVSTTVLNETNKAADFIIRTKVLEGSGKTVGIAESRVTSAGASSTTNQTIKIINPKLWSPESPTLYHAQTTLISKGKITDQVINNFGIRSIHFDAVTGFLLNGKKTLLRGGCIHHDNGPLGSVAIDRAEERKIELLKAYGYNAVRTSHNPPSQQLLDACDRLGLFVIDEAFDMWEEGKNKDDYHLYFKDYWRKDLRSVILRDRNHPAVIIWSIGNEIPERADSSGLSITRELVDEVRLFDSSRPITEAICEFYEHGKRPWSASAPAFALLDAGGYNYQWKEYEPDHLQYPSRVMIGTESVAHDAFENWEQVKKNPWVIGDFVWTAFDYLGETGIGHATMDSQENKPLMEWPWFDAYCGDIDICGFKKPQSYYKDIVWGRSQLEMAVHAPVPTGDSEKVSFWGWPDEQQRWSWPGQEGKLMKVTLYSNYPAVRLELNGKRIGEKPVSRESRLTATFELPYQPGVLKAIGLKDGKEQDTVSFVTPGPPQKLRLKADRIRLRSSGNDLCYVTVEVADSSGLLVPDSEIPVQFSVTGPGELVAVGNGNPSKPKSFQQPVCKTFHGKCLVILRPKGKAGVIKLRAESAGMPPAELSVSTK